MRRLEIQGNPDFLKAEAVGEFLFGGAKVLNLCHQEKPLNAKLGDRTANRHR
jgi:hypothetical protein